MHSQCFGHFCSFLVSGSTLGQAEFQPGTPMGLVPCFQTQPAQISHLIGVAKQRPAPDKTGFLGLLGSNTSVVNEGGGASFFPGSAASTAPWQTAASVRRVLLPGVLYPGEGPGRLPEDHQPRLGPDGPLLRAEEIRLQEAVAWGPGQRRACLTLPTVSIIPFGGGARSGWSNSTHQRNRTYDMS